MVSLQKASLIPGGSDSLAYTTLSGIVAGLVVFVDNLIKDIVAVVTVAF